MLASTSTANNNSTSSSNINISNSGSTGSNSNNSNNNNNGNNGNGAITSVHTSSFTRIRSTTRSTMSKATAVRVSTGKKFSQLLIITPAVAIDNNNDGGYIGPFNSHDSGCGSSGASDASLDEGDGSNDRINVRAMDDRNNNDKSNRLKLLPKVRQHIVTKVSSSSPMRGCGGGGGSGNETHSWRWCSLICSAVRCFRAATHSQQHFGTIHYSSNAGAGVFIGGNDMGSRGQHSIRNPLSNNSRGTSGAGGGTSRFSSNHIYEYTIKSYRSDSNDHDHINNNSNSRGANHSGGDSTDRNNIMYKL